MGLETRFLREYGDKEREIYVETGFLRSACVIPNLGQARFLNKGDTIKNAIFKSLSATNSVIFA